MIDCTVVSRHNGAVRFIAKIDCEESEKDSIKERLAVLWAIENGVGLRSAKLSFADLSFAKLRGADFDGADFRGADFSGTDMRGAKLRDAKLSFADFRGADLSGADLRGANFKGADFRGANFKGVDFDGTDLSGTDLSFADFRGAKLKGVDLTGAKLKGAILPDQYDVPVLEDIHGRMYDVCAGNGNLDMERFCGTAKCIAGWLCTLTGERGLALADELGYDVAASLIYMASDPGLEVLPDYYGTNRKALIYLKQMAEKEGLK